VIVSDLHDAALYAWREAAVRDAVLVHVDAHHDADAKEWDFITISNFVWWALCEGVLREVYWVVPEPSWKTASRRALIEQSLATLARQHDASGAVESGERFVRASIAGRPFTACPLRSLPETRHALLDVDVDYFLVPDIAEELPPIEGSMPWIWPAELLDALRTTVVKPAVVTVATSTRGGFTPLEWKYLAEELCTRLGAGAGEPFEALRSGAEAERLGDLDGAEARYQQAIGLLPSSAGARYRLARLHLLRGDDDAARSAFRDVVGRDASYRAIDSEGRRWHAAGNPVAAARGYRETLRMDPENSYAELGLAQLAAATGDHLEAITHFERALQYCGTLVDAHRGIARSLQAMGGIDRASEHYARSLRLELLGHAPLDAPIATRPRAPRLFDDAHWDIHRRLAALQHETNWLLALDRLHT